MLALPSGPEHTKYYEHPSERLTNPLHAAKRIARRNSSRAGLLEGLDTSAHEADNGRMPAQARIRLLVVDDDPDFRATLRTILAVDERLELLAEASDGAQAVELADELAPDVVAMDVVMPGMDGVEATRLIHSRRPDCRVVLVSGSIFAESSGGRGTDLAKEAGASGYVPKSRAVLDLADAVAAAAGFRST